MGKLNINHSKTIRLTNVIAYQSLMDDNETTLDIIINQMQSYIRTKGVMQVGPLIQYAETYTNNDGELDMNIMFMLQCNNYIHSVEAPYSMYSVIRIPNCMYCRYIGPDDKVGLAYQKIQIEAFEENIMLKDCSYTVFVDSDEEEDTIVADVFIPRAE